MNRLILIEIIFLAMLTGCTTKPVPSDTRSQHTYTKIHEEEIIFSKIKPGEYDIINGIIYENNPNINKKRRTLIAGIPLTEQPEFNIATYVTASKSGDSDALKSLRDKYTQWRIKYIGSELPEDTYSKLEALYRSHTQNLSDARRNLIQKKININAYNEIRSKSYITLITERHELIKHNEPAQIKLYGKVLDRGLNDKEKETLREELLSILTGEYLENTQNNTKMKDTDFNRAQRQFPDERGNTERQGAGSGSGYSGTGIYVCAEPQKLDNEVSRTYNDKVLKDYYLSVIYSTWHKVGPEGSGILDVFRESSGIVHTNVASDIRHIQRIERTANIYLADGSTTSRIWNIEKDIRAAWGPINGCSGGYEDRDKYTTIYKSWHATYEDAMRTIYRSDFTSAIRHSAYSSGLYGVDWICHNACNAFSSMRWNIISNNIDTAIIDYGLFGKYGISPDNDTYFGCVPGNKTKCHYNSGSSKGSSKGYNLSLVYNTNENRFIPSKVRFSSSAPPPDYLDRDVVQQRCSSPYKPCATQWQCADNEICSSKISPECLDNNSCYCITDESTPTHPASNDTPSPSLNDYIGSTCVTDADCGPFSLQCLNIKICGYYPETCIHSKQCPQGTVCGTEVDSVFVENCSAEHKNNGKCSCGVPGLLQ